MFVSKAQAPSFPCQCSRSLAFEPDNARIVLYSAKRMSLVERSDVTCGEIRLVDVTCGEDPKSPVLALLPKEPLDLFSLTSLGNGFCWLFGYTFKGPLWILLMIFGLTLKDLCFGPRFLVCMG